MTQVLLMILTMMSVHQPPPIRTPIMMAITLRKMAQERVAGAMAGAGNHLGRGFPALSVFLWIFPLWTL